MHYVVQSLNDLHLLFSITFLEQISTTLMKTVTIVMCALVGNHLPPIIQQFIDVMFLLVLPCNLACLFSALLI